MASTPRGFGSKSAAASKRLAARRSRRVVFGTILLLAAGMGAVAAGVSFFGRRPAAEVTGTVDSCPARLGNRQTLDQCVSACLSCDHGTVVTCTTACRLKSAN